MPDVSVFVNGREFSVACGAGEEDHLVRLAAFVDKHVRELSHSSGAQAGELRLLLAASLVIADKYLDAEKEISDLQKAVEEAKRKANTEVEAVGPLVDTVAQRIENIAVLLENS